MPPPEDSGATAPLGPSDSADTATRAHTAGGNLTAELPPPPAAQDDGHPTVAADVTALFAACSTPTGYQLLQEVGHGGMGVVYRARDLALARDVAIKLLRPDIPSSGSVAGRFVAEARITGQLQHPGIPAVHQVGTLPDGRPYLAMKLIKGQTLEDLLRQRPEPSPGAGGLSPPAPPDRSRFVAVFEQVCQAVGYAHSRGVIHRDLKPANVMVGAFGEVQVMDWGLAKVVAGAEEERRNADGDGVTTAIFSIRTDGTETRAGSVLGTPAFMSPEQAGGEVAKVDARSDVFSLGGMLCAILTGEPPYTGADAQDVHLKAVRGQLADAFARLDACGAEPELVALCKVCLSVEPAARPADGGQVSETLAGLRAAAAERARISELATTAELARQVYESGPSVSGLNRVLGTFALALAVIFAAGVLKNSAAEKTVRQRAGLDLAAEMLTHSSNLAAPDQSPELRLEAYHLQRLARQRLEWLLREDPNPDLLEELRTHKAFAGFRERGQRRQLWNRLQQGSPDDEEQWQEFWAKVEEEWARRK